jgi:hypothetical protein
VAEFSDSGAGFCDVQALCAHITNIGTQNTLSSLIESINLALKEEITLGDSLVNNPSPT